MTSSLVHGIYLLLVVGVDGAGRTVFCNDVDRNRVEEGTTDVPGIDQFWPVSFGERSAGSVTKDDLHEFEGISI